MEYKIVEARDTTGLEEEVNSYMEIGYRPIGGVAAVYDRDSKFLSSMVQYFYQAMIKEEKQ